MNYHVVSTTNSFSHTFLPACFPCHLGHRCLLPVILIETLWSWDKFLLFQMLLLWFGLFLWVCKDENSSLHRACNPSNEKGETQKISSGREEKIIIVQLQMSLCLTWEAGHFWPWDLWKKLHMLGCFTSLNSQVGHPGCLRLYSGACPSLPCSLSPAWHASPSRDGEGVCPNTGMVASGVCVLLVWYQGSFKNNQAGKTVASGKITLGRCLRRD